jgi:hypothetical protein
MSYALFLGRLAYFRYSVHWLEKILRLENNLMTSQTLTTSLLPPALPTLDLGSQTGNYTASGITKFAASAIVTGSATDDKILGLQVRIESGTATLGVVNTAGILTADGTIGKISYAYNSLTKLLRLTDTSNDTSAIGADFQAVLREVGISGASGNVAISANLGRPVYRSDNGNYYEFVTSGAGSSEGQLTTWTEANSGATTRTFLGLNGYLATITSAGENQFLTSTFDSRGWIGGRAAVANNVRTWTWVGGPEKDKSFWIGDAATGTSTGTGTGYANWDTSEPNNFLPGSPGGLGEPYAQFTTNGKWNDLADDPSYQPVVAGGSPYRPNGYWVEYGDGTVSATLANTRDSIALTQGTVNTTSPLDLVYYDPATGKISFAFSGATYNAIPNESLTGDTPLLTSNVTNETYPGSPSWKLVSAQVDVDSDKTSDMIFTNTVTGAVAVLFGAARTPTTREFAYRGGPVLVTTAAGGAIEPKQSDGWSLEFASNKIGANDAPGIFWRNSISGVTATWTLSAPSGGTTVTTNVQVGLNVGANNTWKAIGDGEFNQVATTREVIWVNSKTQEMVTWSMGAARDLASIQAPKYSLTAKTVPLAAGWSIAAMSKVGSAAGNDLIVWQKTGTAETLIWNMRDGMLSGAPVAVNLAVSTDRLKVLADVDADGILDYVVQNDFNGTIAAYTLTSALALKNTAVPRTQYISNLPAGYRPGKNGTGAALELVNVAQYGA